MKQNRYYELRDITSTMVHIKISEVHPTAEELNDYIRHHSDVIFNKENTSLIYEISEAKFLSTEQRVHIGLLLKENAPLIRKNIICAAYVNTSVIASMILKGILLVSPWPIPCKVFTNMDAAVKWCKEQQTLVQALKQ